jgi:hypothetical protein
LDFEAKGFDWSYGDKPTFVLTRRDLPRTRETVEFYSGDLAHLVHDTSGMVALRHEVRSADKL